jgi:hypothetical protein
VSRLPSLNALRCFEAAARSGSFSRAAEELNVTQSAVSHQVRQLEQWFGLSLFDRLGFQCEGAGPDIADFDFDSEHPLRDGFQLCEALDVVGYPAQGVGRCLLHPVDLALSAGFVVVQLAFDLLHPATDRIHHVTHAVDHLIRGAR